MRIIKTCELCGADYWAGNGKAKYCSDTCRKAATKARQDKWRAEHPDYHKAYHAKHPDAVERFKQKNPNYERDRWRKIRGTVESEKACTVCGATFKTANPNQRTCCKKCSSKLNYARKQKRIPKEQIVDKNITLEALYKRDSGVCYLCGKPCDWNDKNETTVGSTYPSIDHVIPISRGGLHAWNNVRLAHFECNWRKSDTLIGE